MKKILSAAMAFIMCASSALSVSAYYDAVSRANEDPTESIIEFEAEDFKYSDGFVVTEDLWEAVMNEYKSKGSRGFLLR